MYIEIIREQADKLSRERWEFYIQDSRRGDLLSVILSDWSTQARPTRRHDYRFTKRFHSHDTRGGDAIPPAIPQDVLDEVKSEIMKRIDFAPVMERVEAMQERDARRRERLGY